MSAPATRLTVEDLRATIADERHLGFGYACRAEDLSAAQAARVDRAVVAVANSLGLDRDDLFAWSNSMWGRWLHDGIQERDENPIGAPTVRRYLNAEIIAALKADLGELAELSAEVEAWSS